MARLGKDKLTGPVTQNINDPTLKTWKEVYEGIEYTVWHGSPFDRGMSDSWYSRKVNPHYWNDGTGHRSVSREDMTEQQVAEYIAGYAYNEYLGGKKDYGV